MAVEGLGPDPDWYRAAMPSAPSPQAGPPPPGGRGRLAPGTVALIVVPLVVMLLGGALFLGTRSGTHGAPTAGWAAPSTPTIPGATTAPTTSVVRPAGPRDGATLLATLPTAGGLDFTRPGAGPASWKDTASSVNDAGHPRSADSASQCLADRAPSIATRLYNFTDPGHGFYGRTILTVRDFTTPAEALTFSRAHLTPEFKSCLSLHLRQEVVDLTNGVVTRDALFDGTGYGGESTGVAYEAAYSIGRLHCVQYRHLTWTLVGTAVITSDFETCLVPFRHDDEARVVGRIVSALTTGSSGATSTTTGQQPI